MNRQNRRAAKSSGGGGATSLSPLVAQALRHHQAGQLAVAEGLYRQQLSVNGRDADAAYLLGVLCAQRGAFDEALRLLSLAVQSRPAFADAWFNLGTLHLRRASAPEAEVALRNCLKQQPGHAGALWNLACLLLERNVPAEAEACFRAFLKLQPGNADALVNLAASLAAQSKFKDAAETARRVLALRADAKAEAILGQALYRLDEIDEAEPLLRKAIDAFPKEAAYRTALAALLTRTDDLYEARDLFDKLLADFPDDPIVRFNYGMFLSHLARYEDALKEIDVAAAAMPDDPGIETSRGMLLLQMGRLKEGWQLFARRFDMSGSARQTLGESGQHFSFPDGFKGRQVLVRPEQGIGDQIIFASALPDLIAEADSVEIVAPPKLSALFQRSFPQARVVDSGQDKARKSAAAIPLGSLFQFYRPDIASFPSRPYLKADPELVETFRQRLDALGGGLKVGIAWTSTRITRERIKVCFPDLAPWKPILSVPGVTFVNCQPMADPSVIRKAEEAVGVRIHDFPDVDLFDGLDRAAAMMSALDLVISTGSANAFLAAALGVPVWLFYVLDEHWDLLGTPDRCPWLSSLVPVHRRWHEGWENAIQRMATALDDSARQGRLTAPVCASPLPPLPADWPS